MNEKKLDLVRKHDLLVCVDSDGCLLDNMELKHKECFCPATVNVWDLQPISKYARKAAEFVNLYSRSRGWNRFPALVRTLDLLFERPEVKAVGLQKPDLTSLRQWIETTPSLSSPALRRYVEENHIEDETLLRAARWGEEVDENIRRIVRNILPFPDVKPTLAKLREYADVMIVSATPDEALIRELTNCGVIEYFDCVAGQNTGTKSESIRMALETGGYARDQVLKVGDAASDLKAAQDNGVLFFPIVPGKENESWQELREVALQSFVAGEYRQKKMDAYIDAFLASLPDAQTW